MSSRVCSILIAGLFMITAQARAEGGGYLSPMPITPTAAATVPVAAAPVVTAPAAATVTTATGTYPINGITNTILAYPAKTKSILSYYTGIDTNKIDFEKFSEIVARGNYQEIYDQVEFLATNKEVINAGTLTSFPYYQPPMPVPEPYMTAGAKTAAMSTAAATASTVGVVAAVGVGVAAASGGGGGSSKSGSGSDTADFFGRQDLPYLTDPSNFVDAEMQAYPLGALELENAQFAWARGLTGRGVNIGFFDWFHTDLTSDTSLGPRVVYRNLDITDDCNDPNNDCHHGVTVMTYAAAARDGTSSLGIAYEANLMMQSVYAEPTLHARTLADNGANIINFSCENCATQSDLLYITNKGVFVSIATGNDSASEPAMPADYASQFNYSVVAVTGVVPDGNGGVDNYVYNACGTQKEFCMAAYTPNGTSFAAPQIAAAAAVLKQGWSFLTASQIGQILLYSAKDIGDPGVDVVYGHGLLDLKAATSPIGSVTVASGMGQQSFSSATIAQNQHTAFGDAFSASKNSNGNVYIVDSFGRDFAVKTSENLSVASKPTVSAETLDSFGMKAPEMKKVQFGDKFAMQFSNRTMESGKNDMSSFAEYSPSQNSSMKLGFSTSMNNVQVENDRKFNKNSFISPQLYDNGFMNFSNNNQIFYQATELKASEHITTKFSTLYSKFSDHDQYLNIDDPQREYTNDYTTSMLETKYKPSEDVSFNFKNGMTHEFNSLLGTRTEGSFDMANGADTYFTGLDTSYDLTHDINLFGTYTTGVTKAKPTASSSFTNVSDIITDSFSVTATKSALLGDDSLSVSVGQPLRVRSGTASGITQLVDHDTGALGFGQFSQRLTPTGRTMLFQTAYDKALNSRTNMNFALEYASQPDHQQDKAGEAALMAKLVYKLN